MFLQGCLYEALKAVAWNLSWICRAELASATSDGVALAGSFTLSRAKFSRAKFNRAKCSRAKFNRAKFSRATWLEVKGKIESKPRNVAK